MFDNMNYPIYTISAAWFQHVSTITGFTGTPQSARPTNKASQIQICVWHLGVHVSGVHASSRWFGLAASQCPGSSASPTLALEISMDDGHHKTPKLCAGCFLWDVHAGMVFEEYFYHLCSNIWQITDMTSREHETRTPSFGVGKTWGDYFFRAAWLQSIWLTCWKGCWLPMNICCAPVWLSMTDNYFTWVLHGSTQWRGQGNQLLSTRGSPMKDMSRGRKIKHQISQKP